MAESQKHFREILLKKDNLFDGYIKSGEKIKPKFEPGEYLPGVLKTPITNNRYRLMAVSEYTDVLLKKYLDNNGYSYNRLTRLAKNKQNSSLTVLEIRNAWGGAPYDYREKIWMYLALLAAGIDDRIGKSNNGLLWDFKNKRLSFQQKQAFDYFINNFTVIPLNLHPNLSEQNTNITYGELEDKIKAIRKK